MKQIAFWGILVLIIFTILEIVLTVHFFHSKSDYPLAVIEYWQAARETVYRKIYKVQSVGIWERDPKFGYVHKINSRGKHRTTDFDVTYTIGEKRERLTPDPVNNVGQLLFLGGSYTFGHGVNDDEVYTHILGRKYWTDWKIVNRAVMGWGTSHSYLVLSEEIESDAPPSAVIYGMIPHHIARNYIRTDWVRLLAKYDRGHPHFELLDGILVYQGLVNMTDTIDLGQDLRTKEMALTVSFLIEMNKKCAQQQIPFAVILLSQTTWPPIIIRTLVEYKIPFLDLSNMRLEMFAHDNHPNRNDHEQLAKVIAKSFLSGMLHKKEQEKMPPLSISEK